MVSINSSLVCQPLNSETAFNLVFSLSLQVLITLPLLMLPVDISNSFVSVYLIEGVIRNIFFITIIIITVIIRSYIASLVA